ncbi:hypothetical protein TSOC_014349 [Tetrabaena socialis]|uniref:Uncharacterized protein n=1 Tax=Tetrabaena socialis TaxID=47790 RepID=A0A2J7ZHW5_9CHLO|nr:hypothetical protein TSOC_014349 [Tetrabaena socialis]|eukprot:PNG99860.1 hypothetical protein TSOC_014349 [Tetrabaena socialis]
MSSRLQEAAAIAAVLVNASAAQSLSRALPLAGERCQRAPNTTPPAAEEAVQLAMVAVLCNAQRRAAALRAACAGAVAGGSSRSQLGPRPTGGAAAPQQMQAQGRLQAAEDVPTTTAGDLASDQRGAAAEQAAQGDGSQQGKKGGPAGPHARPLAAGVKQRAGVKWNREQLEVRSGVGSGAEGITPRGPAHASVLVQHMREMPPNAGFGILEAIQKLGLDAAIDQRRVRNKLSHLRSLLAHGRDPLEDIRVPRARRHTYNWRAWLRQAYLALPNREGTMDDAAAILLADPSIAPLLDRRRAGVPGRAGGCVAGVAEELATRRAKTPKRGVPGLPYLGKGQ